MKERKEKQGFFLFNIIYMICNRYVYKVSYYAKAIPSNFFETGLSQLWVQVRLLWYVLLICLEALLSR